MTSEHKIQNDIRIALSRHQCTVFRVNVGSVKTPDGRFFSAGVPSGHPDLYGFRWSDNQIFYIEVKNERGRPRKDQIRFHDFLQSHNVIHGIARSPDDAVKIVKEGLVGYGFKQWIGGDLMDKFLDYDDIEPYSEADAKEEYDEWMKQAIMDDKAQ